ncbi:hypothetical protein Tsubulata_046512 [Turnera subulata]|uniref:Uncharacterized protein n=1 Tax=Turnera subulata TaxID=218843 RepID=A0A9Q0J2E7_9ROSI|nr:hypothetical protein Tsubulata_046512 [Turnera subulata]
MGDSSKASDIHMVQNFIEACLIHYLTKEECMIALYKHANILPVITSTVWNGLEKENKEFFQAYEQSKSKGVRMSKEEMRQLILDISEESSGQNFVEWRIKSNQEQSARGN